MGLNWPLCLNRIALQIARQGSILGQGGDIELTAALDAADCEAPEPRTTGRSKLVW